MTWLRELMQRLRWNQDAQFGIGAALIFIAAFFLLNALYGCASFEQQVYTIERGVFDEDARCIIVHWEFDRYPVRYLMGHNGFCQGEARI